MRYRAPGRLTAAVVVVLALFITACGGSDDSSTDLADPDVDADVEASQPAVAPSGDLLDLEAKPPVDDEYLGDVDELVVTDIVEGTGAEAVSGNVILVQYVGVLAADGSQFDASWDNDGAPLTVNLGVGQVIPGWDEGLQGMRVGGRRVLQIPSDLAYGALSPGPSIPANADLVFVVDLLDVVVRPTPEPTPTPIPSPPIPEDALGSFTELGVRDLVEGSGREVQRGDIVSVQYVGVDAITGEEFDSTWSRGGDPFELIAGVSGVIEGWQQGLLGAQVGTERILQIPADQAYGEADLVFLVEIEEIIEAPLGHQIVFEGPAPTELEVTTLAEGSGVGAEQGDVVSAHVVVLRHSDSDIIQSTYPSQTVTPLFISPEGMLPGLNDGMVGIQVGETRQVIVPASVAFPDGVPPDAGIEADDALVFVVEAVDISELDLEE